MKTEKTHTSQDLLLAIALRERALELRRANDIDEQSPKKPLLEWLDIAIMEAKGISDVISDRLRTS